jgi:hypothetical protein
MASEIAFGMFGNSFAAPADEDVLKEARFRILDFYVGKLYSAFRKLIDEANQFTLCIELSE